jgi:uncharacterized membrane protein YedE/YeeE
MVPMLLILGNKSFGVSSNLRHICAACIPANISFFKYDWKKELWNLVFIAGALIGSFIAWNWLADYGQSPINAKLMKELNQYAIYDYSEVIPKEVINWKELFTLKGVIMTVIGGFFVGFGTRYADGCTSGHSIMGLSNLQWPSLVATCCFMVGGFFTANIILPYVLRL